MRIVGKDFYRPGVLQMPICQTNRTNDALMASLSQYIQHSALIKEYETNAYTTENTAQGGN